LVSSSPPVFVASTVIEEFASAELKNEAMAFRGVHNLLRSSDPAEAVDKLITRYIHRIEPYGARLISASRASPDIRTLLASRNNEAQALARGEFGGRFYNVRLNLRESAMEQDRSSLEVLLNSIADTSDLELKEIGSFYTLLIHCLDHDDDDALSALVEKCDVVTDFLDVIPVLQVLYNHAAYASARDLISKVVIKYPESGPVMHEWCTQFALKSGSTAFRSLVDTALRTRG
jgi:hypothetical protein